MRKVLSEYKTRKEHVLSLFRGYDDLSDSIDSLEPLSGPFEQRARQLRDDRFIIAVCGQVKAGKSTFINALIGAELLPTHQLQKSSVLVDICSAPDWSLLVEFGDGRKRDIFKDVNSEGAERIKVVEEQLHKFGSLQDEYRDLPVAEIENYILSQELSTNSNLFKKLVEHLGGVKDHDLLDQFLDERGSPGDIPVHITLSQPLMQPELSELRIVDTPGVNALGGVQDRTYNFIEAAHATLFVHDIRNTASEPFRHFIERGLSQRSKESALLVLTHAGNFSEQEKQGYLEQMRRDFPEFRDRIIPVDSELRLIEQMLDNGNTLEEVKQKIRDSGDKVKGRLLATISYSAPEGEDSEEEVIRKRANFDSLEEAVRQFASDARFAALRNILDSLHAKLDTGESSLSSKVELLKKKERDPQEFEREKDKRVKELNRYQRKVGDFVDKLEGKYMGHDASWRSKFEDIQDSFNKRLSDSELKSKGQIRKHFTDAKNEIDQALDSVFDRVRKECQQELNKIDGDFSDDTKHRSPQIDLPSIERAAQKSAKKKEPRFRKEEKFSLAVWNWVKPFTKEVRVRDGFKIVVDEKKEIKHIKGDLLEAFRNVIEAIVQGDGVVEKTVRSYVRSVRQEGKRLTEQRKDDIELINMEKKENNEIRNEVEVLSTQRNRVEELFEQVQNLKANI